MFHISLLLMFVETKHRWTSHLSICLVLFIRKTFQGFFFRVRFPFCCLSIINLLFGSLLKRKKFLFHSPPSKSPPFQPFAASSRTPPSPKILKSDLFPLNPFLWSLFFLILIQYISSLALIYRLEVSRTIIYFIIGI